MIFSSFFCVSRVNPSAAVLSVIPHKKDRVGRRLGGVRYTEFFFYFMFFLKNGYTVSFT